MAFQQQQQFRGRRHPRTARTPVRFRPDPMHRILALEAAAHDFEMARSFEDDALFCPAHLLTDDEFGSDACSDTSSGHSASPYSMSLALPAMPMPMGMSAANIAAQQQSAAAAVASLQQQQQHLQQQQQQEQQHTRIFAPLATRTRNPIPIVNPNTMAVNSPPPFPGALSDSSSTQSSSSPAGRRRW